MLPDFSFPLLFSFTYQTGQVKQRLRGFPQVIVKAKTFLCRFFFKEKNPKLNFARVRYITKARARMCSHDIETAKRAHDIETIAEIKYD